MEFLISSTSALSQQFIALTICFILCSLLGIERQIHHKNAGVKTHVLVGMGACVFTLISAYGFSAIETSTLMVDPSRIAAQIVSGIGFIGAGVIFVNNDAVRGLTTAATIWLSAALGVACGALMLPIALYALALHYLMVFIVGPLINRIPSSGCNMRTVIEYESGHGVMHRVLEIASSLGYKAAVTSTAQIKTEEGNGTRVVMKFEGRMPQKDLLSSIASLPYVHAVDQIDRNDLD